MFLVLAAQYESWTLPLAVILIVPMSIFCALVGVKLTHGDNNVFTQIALFVLVGLASKNAILIVEFARELEHHGRTIVEAALEASRQRLRPILMTSIAFIMGVLPLVFSHGAGSEMRHAMGVAVFAGMLGVTFFGLFPDAGVLRPAAQAGRTPGEEKTCRGPATPPWQNWKGHIDMNKLHMIAKGVAPVLAALLMTACAAPEFKQPAMDVPTAFKESQLPDAPAPVKVAADGSTWKQAQAAEAQPRGEWWLAFNDPALNELVARSHPRQRQPGRGRRPRQAGARHRRHRRGGPHSASGHQRRRPASAPVRRGARPAGRHAGRAGQRVQRQPDGQLRGRPVRPRIVERQRGPQRRRSVEATYRSVLLSVQADVAQTYFRLRATDAELETLNRTVQTREENVKVNQRRFDLGDIGEFDLSRAKTELATSRAEAIGLQRQRVTTEHALAVLLGKPAASYTAGASPLLDTSLLPVIPAGMPSSLLERRPDIASAQRAMEASNARIGVAKSAMFPA